MTATESAERRHDESSGLFARQAIPADADAFVELARMCVAETGAAPFSEDAARYCFAGLARSDPAIHVLQAGDEIAGFAIVRMHVCPLTGRSNVHQERLFVRADMRNAETEALLHGMSHAVVRSVQPAEAFVFVATSEHARHVFSRLVATGYEVTGVRMAYRGKSPAPAVDEVSAELERSVIH